MPWNSSLNGNEFFKDTDEAYEQFPLTDIQQAYWVGRRNTMPLGGVTTHFYYEIDCYKIDLTRLTKGWQHLIERHPMLRTIITHEGIQRVLTSVPLYQIPVWDLRYLDPFAQQEKLKAKRREISHQVLPSDRWPLFDIRLAQLDEGNARLFLSFDALIMDERSRNLLLSEWKTLYHNPAAKLAHPKFLFKDYVLHKQFIKKSKKYLESIAYWENRIADFPPAPVLPLAKDFNEITNNRFTRLESRLDPGTWSRLKLQAEKFGLRPTTIVLAAFAESLKAWSRKPQMAINLSVVDRYAQSSEFKKVVGDFSSSLLLALDTECEDSFLHQAINLQKRLEKDLRHSDVSGVEVIRKLIEKRGSDFGAIMPVVFTSHLSIDQKYKDKNPMAWLGNIIFEITQTPQVCLDYQVRERQSSFIAIWDFVAELFPKNMIKDMFDSHITFMRRLASNPSSWTQSRYNRMRQLIPASHLKLYDMMNSTEAKKPPALIHENFFKNARMNPEHPAVIAHDKILTYKELQRRSTLISQRLIQQGAAPNKLVAVVMDKGWEQVIALFGILQTGGAYLPIDPHLPPERFSYLLNNCQITIALTQPHWSDLEWSEDVKLFYIGKEIEKPVIKGPEHLERDVFRASTDDLAYVVHTSGSTGVPKGVMISHQAAMNTLEDINRRFCISSEDRLLSLSSLSFDLSVYDIFGILNAGGTIVMPAAAGTKKPSEWISLIKQHKVTIWNTVPALMQLLVEYANQRNETLGDDLRLVLLSGDWIPIDLPQKISAISPNAKIVSLGGATEASIWSIFFPIEELNPFWKSIPYGFPMQNQTFYVLNSDMAPCPIWVPGELYIGGKGLADGYWRSTEETQRNFFIHPHTNKRLYRTGDIGRYLPDGSIELMGREDLQVKIRGYRIELREIEIILREHPSVKDCVVVSTGGDKIKKSLVAYVKSNNDETDITKKLRAFAKKKLPEHMRPSVIVEIEKFPLTLNGKIDRDTLSKLIKKHEIERISIDSEFHEFHELQEIIEHIVKSVLEFEEIDPQMSLLELGADSIDMIRLVTRIESRTGCLLSLDEVYESPTISALSTAIGRLASEPKNVS